MTMSVLVRDGGGGVHVFCKGSPKKVAGLCTAATKPADCDAAKRRAELRISKM